MTNESNELTCDQTISALVDEIGEEKSAGQIKFIAVLTTHNDGQQKSRFVGAEQPATIVGLIETFKIQFVMDTVNKLEDDGDMTGELRMVASTKSSQ